MAKLLSNADLAFKIEELLNLADETLPLIQNEDVLSLSSLAKLTKIPRSLSLDFLSLVAILRRMSNTIFLGLPDNLTDQMALLFELERTSGLIASFNEFVRGSVPHDKEQGWKRIGRKAITVVRSQYLTAGQNTPKIFSTHVESLERLYEELLSKQKMRPLRWQAIPPKKEQNPDLTFEHHISRTIPFEGIRLLRVNSAVSPTLSCSLTQDRPEILPSFVALTCYLDDAQPIRQMYINDVSVNVTGALYSALVRLQRDKVDAIWVDSLCMNSQDTSKKLVHFSSMGEAFRLASQVVAWLGRETVFWESPSDCSIRSKFAAPHANLFVSAHRLFIRIFSIASWTRIWTMKELARKKVITTLCDRYRIPVAVFPNDFHIVSAMDSDEFINDMLMDTIQDLSASSKQQQATSTTSLLDALFRMRVASGQPREQIYALLRQLFELDETSTGDVNKDSSIQLTKLLIQKDFPLDFIYLRSASRSLTISRLPSWAVDWSDLDDSLAAEEFQHIWQNVLPQSLILHAGENANYGAVSQDILTVHGVMVGDVKSLTSGFLTDLSDDHSDEVNATAMDSREYPDLDYSTYIFEALIEMELLQLTTGPNIHGPVQLWASTADSRFALPVDELESKTLTMLSKWFEKNRLFSIFGRTMEWWNLNWAAHQSNTQQGRWQTTCSRFLTTKLMSGMRLAVFGVGELAWLHPQSQRGDKLVKVIGCDRHVVLRPSTSGYQVIGEGRPYWFGGSRKHYSNFETLVII